ncbi:GntR family transcriptional regulator [Emcibacter sp.]|uniref:GntR family transcriptional regulator n=1 Tax=Emcibacter sp. TaxID=1979954 RepID=UPI002AA74E66|nr:GntR family transcriptional regulator [Emcibacter sp.]
MAEQWKNDQPIYLQLKEQVRTMILEGILAEGEMLPSVRKVAVEYQINPITASKAYSELVDEGLVEKRRGLGMFVLEGARENLLKAEQQKFLRDEWPEIIKRIARLGLDPKKLVAESTENQA